jgi:hypothetical protein
MTYTPEQVRNMSDAELCEALSLSREEKPTKIEEYILTSPLGNWWRYRYEVEWISRDWFLPENWTKIFDEIVKNLVLELTIHYSTEGIYSLDYLYWDKPVLADRLERAVLEAALMVEQEEK